MASTGRSSTTIAAASSLRHALPVLRTGAGGTLLTDDARRLLVHRRRDDAMQAIVAITAAKQRSGSCWMASPQRAGVIAGTVAQAYDAEDAQLALTLPPLSGAVLVA